MNKINDICPECNKGKLLYQYPNFPYTEEHLICSECDSTFNIYYKQMFTEDVQNISGNMLDVLLEEFKKRKIEISMKEEDSIYEDIQNILEKYSTGDYRHNH